jgi:hypothetical protein
LGLLLFLSTATRTGALMSGRTQLTTLAGEESGSRERELGRRRLHLRDWKGRGSDGIGEEAAFSLSSQPRATREAGPSGLYRTHG